MLSMLQDVIRDYDGFVELRFHAKTFQTLSVAQGKLDSSTVRHRNGVGVRVLEGGTWGFASTGDCTPSAVRAAVEQARLGALASAAGVGEEGIRLCVEDLGGLDAGGSAEYLRRIPGGL